MRLLQRAFRGVSVLIVFASVMTLGTGCVSARKGLSTAPEEILAQICQPGSGLQAVRGDVWMSISSEKEGNARFPARIDVRRVGDLRIEITNLFGGPEASVRVTDDRIEVRRQGAASAEIMRSPDGSWNGIPVRWAKRLFLGEVPCPPAGTWRVTREGDDRVRALSGNERYDYVWSLIEGKFTADSLVWEKVGDGPAASGSGVAKVEFGFRAREDRSRVPRQWEAQSAAGSVKIRWKERENVR